MTFTLLGNLIEGTSNLACQAMEGGHRALDDTLDATGLSAFIPPAVHEVSDGVQGIVKRGVGDVGHTTGAVLRSFDQTTLHGRDKSLGGNLRQPRNNKPLCKWCHKKPRADGFDHCGRYCANEDRRAHQGRQRSRH